VNDIGERVTTGEDVAGIVAAATAACAALAPTRLRGELVRTTFQLRFLADQVLDGAYLRATIDTADPEWTPGPRPDLRRVLQPIGPVLVFAASNFPFAFSVAGGDTASGLAAGCPVVVKIHPGHPVTSVRTAALVRRAAETVRLPADVLQVISSEAAGRTALLDRRIQAGAFTGSLRAGRALFDLAAARHEPIPFFAEMGSLNPVFVTRTAARERGAQLLAGFRDSFTLGAGQFCTKPGLLVVPRSLTLDDLGRDLGAAPPARLLTDSITAGFQAGLAQRARLPDVRVLVAGGTQDDGRARPTLLVAELDTVLAHAETLLGECFGPLSVIATYTDEAQLLQLASTLEGQLTATVHGGRHDAVLDTLVPLLARRAGRVLFGGWPTGVSVSWAMQHGGPYPATTSAGHTSVGSAAIDRFLRPVAYQSMPDQLLPPALRQDNPWHLPRTVNGRLVPAPTRQNPTEAGHR
jgi:NADP-dependent aldehyde dehydrogenase